MNLYVDASAFAKLLIAEPETRLMQEVWREASRITSSWLTRVEARSALTRARRSGRLTPRRHDDAKDEAERLLSAAELVDVGPAIIASAAELAELYALRAYDAVHLASALALEEPELVVATWDNDLRGAVLTEGLTLVG